MGLDARAICHVVVKFLGLELLYQTKWHFLYLTLLSLKLNNELEEFCQTDGFYDRRHSRK